MTGLVMSSILLLFLSFSLAVSVSETSSPCISINQGLLCGNFRTWRGSRLYQFLGIPYAAPPIGAKRFLKPEPAKPWTGIRNATQYGPSCIQPNSFDSSEDCLFLNIYINGDEFDNRAQTKLKSVMVYIHGGFHRRGSGKTQGELAAPLVLIGDVIVVTLNYRLGGFGWLYLGADEPEISGNMGLWDQNLALTWIRKNIAYFGGDPSKVTIFGESAGSRSISAHLLSAHSVGLFRSAIMQSGSMFDHFSQNYMKNVSDRIVTEIGCSESLDLLNCLQTTGAERLIENPSIVTEVWPIFDGHFLPDSLEKSLIHANLSNISILAGAEKEDGNVILFSVAHGISTNWKTLNISRAENILRNIYNNVDTVYWLQQYFTSVNIDDPYEIRKALIKAATNRAYLCSTIIFQSLIVNSTYHQTQVYGYYHTQSVSKKNASKSPDEWTGVFHASENPFVWGEPLLNSGNYDPEDIILSMRMLNIWSTFAKTGKPPNQGSLEWPKFSHDSFPAVNLNSKLISQIETAIPQFCIDNWSRLYKVIQSYW